MHAEIFNHLAIVYFNQKKYVLAEQQWKLARKFAINWLAKYEDEKNKLEIINPNLHGIALRDLRLPADIIILSIIRADQMLITHGYTRLRLGDVVTVVGSKESLGNLSLRFDG